MNDVDWFQRSMLSSKTSCNAPFSAMFVKAVSIIDRRNFLALLLPRVCWLWSGMNMRFTLFSVVLGMSVSQIRNPTLACLNVVHCAWPNVLADSLSASAAGPELFKLYMMHNRKTRMRNRLSRSPKGEERETRLCCAGVDWSFCRK